MIDYLLLMLAVLLLSAGQISQKYVASNMNRCSVMNNKSFYAMVFFMCLGTACWFLALRSIPLTQAYPFMSLSVFLVMLYAALVLKENISSRQWLGGIIIFIGLYLSIQ